MRLKNIKLWKLHQRVEPKFFIKKIEKKATVKWNHHQHEIKGFWVWFSSHGSHQSFPAFPFSSYLLLCDKMFTQNPQTWKKNKTEFQIKMTIYASQDTCRVKIVKANTQALIRSAEKAANPSTNSDCKTVIRWNLNKKSIKNFKKTRFNRRADSSRNPQSV